MRNLRLFPLMALALCLVFSGCKRDKPQPSKEYFKARTMWIDLLREKRSKAYLAPEVDEVLELLRSVDPKSLDATSAQSLIEEIQSGRATAKTEEADLQAKIEQAKRAGQVEPSAVAFQGIIADGGGVAEPTAAKSPDAGPKEPVAGMSESEFTSLFGRCFEYKNDAVVGGVQSGQVWGLRDSMGCRQDFPNFVTNSVLLVDGRVGAVRSSAELAPVKYKMVDGKLVPVGDEDEKPKPAAPVAPPAPPPADRNSANLVDSTPKQNQNLNDVTPKQNQNLNDVTPR